MSSTTQNWQVIQQLINPLKMIHFDNLSPKQYRVGEIHVGVRQQAGSINVRSPSLVFASMDWRSIIN